MDPWRRHLWRHTPLFTVAVAVAALAAFALFGQRTTTVTVDPAPGLDQVAGMRLRSAELTSILNSRPDPATAVSTWATVVQSQSGVNLDRSRTVDGPTHPRTLAWEAVHDRVLAVARHAFDAEQLEAAVADYLTAVDRLTAITNGVDPGPALPPLTPQSTEMS